MSMPTGIAALTDHTLSEFLAATAAVLILTRSDCGYCSAYLTDVTALLRRGALRVQVGVVTLDQPGATQFKRERPWLAQLAFLPYQLVYRQGCQIDSFATSRATYLCTRVTAVLNRPAPANTTIPGGLP